MFPYGIWYVFHLVGSPLSFFLSLPFVTNNPSMLFYCRNSINPLFFNSHDPFLVSQTFSIFTFTWMHMPSSEGLGLVYKKRERVFLGYLAIMLFSQLYLFSLKFYYFHFLYSWIKFHLHVFSNAFLLSIFCCWKCILISFCWSSAKRNSKRAY